MLDDIDAGLDLGLLDELAVGAHADLAVGLGELVADEGGGVETRKSDELPAVAELGEAADVGLLLVAAHGGLPVEGRRKVVGELLLGPDGVHALGELLGLSVVGQLGLHPDGVAVGRVGDGAVDGAVAATLEAVVTLAGTGRVPVEEDLLAEKLAGDGAGLAVGDLLALDGGLVLGGEVLAVGEVALGDDVKDGLVETLEVGLGEPVVLDSLELGTGLAGGLGLHHELSEGLKVGVGASDDESVVAGIDGGGDESGGLGIGTGNAEEVGAHDISLGTDGDEAVDVLLDGDEDLAGHVTALLGTRGLILNVDTGSTLLNEELGELHDGSKTTVTGIGIGNDGAEVVVVVELLTLGLGDGETLLALLAVVEELSHEEMANLVGDGGLNSDISMVGLNGSSSPRNSRRGSQQDPGRARQKRRRSRMIASRRRRRYRGTWPSGSPWWAPSSRMCKRHRASIVE